MVVRYKMVSLTNFVAGASNWLGHLGPFPCGLSYSNRLDQYLHIAVSRQHSKKVRVKLQYPNIAP